MAAAPQASAADARPRSARTSIHTSTKPWGPAKAQFSVGPTPLRSLFAHNTRVAVPSSAPNARLSASNTPPPMRALGAERVVRPPPTSAIRRPVSTKGHRGSGSGSAHRLPPERRVQVSATSGRDLPSGQPELNSTALTDFISRSGTMPTSQAVSGWSR